MNLYFKVQTLLYVLQVKVAYINNKPPLVGAHVTILTVCVGCFVHVTPGGTCGIMPTARPGLEVI